MLRDIGYNRVAGKHDKSFDELRSCQVNRCVTGKMTPPLKSADYSADLRVEVELGDKREESSLNTRTLPNQRYAEKVTGLS